MPLTGCFKCDFFRKVCNPSRSMLRVGQTRLGVTENSRPTVITVVFATIIRVVTNH